MASLHPYIGPINTKEQQHTNIPKNTSTIITDILRALASICHDLSHCTIDASIKLSKQSDNLAKFYIYPIQSAHDYTKPKY